MIEYMQYSNSYLTKKKDVWTHLRWHNCGRLLHTLTLSVKLYRMQYFHVLPCWHTWTARNAAWPWGRLMHCICVWMCSWTERSPWRLIESHNSVPHEIRDLSSCLSPKWKRPSESELRVVFIYMAKNSSWKRDFSDASNICKAHMGRWFWKIKKYKIEQLRG